MAAASWPCGSPGRGLAAASRRRSPRPPRPCPRRVRAVRDAVVPLDREWDVRAWVRPRPPGPVRASPTPWTPGQCPARGCGWCTTETPYSEYLNPPTPTHTGRNRYVNVYRSQAKLRPTQLLPTDTAAPDRSRSTKYPTPGAHFSICTSKLEVEAETRSGPSATPPPTASVPKLEIRSRSRSGWLTLATPPLALRLREAATRSRNPKLQRVRVNVWGCTVN